MVRPSGNVPLKTRHALMASAVCFLVVDIFIAASVGVADWFYSSTVVRYNPFYFRDDDNLQTIITEMGERRIGVNGRVVETLQTVFDLSAIDMAVQYGSFKCVLTADWNFWLQSKDMDCHSTTDKFMEQTYKDLGEDICRSICDNQLMLYRNTYPRCDYLEEAAGGGDDWVTWFERAVCSGAKGVLSMLVLAMTAATVGLFMSCFCHRKPQLIIIPGLFCMILTAIVVVAYGAAISSTYPFLSDARTDILIEMNPQVDGAQSNVAKVQVGFGLAIAASVLSLISCFLAYMGRYFPSDGTELQVVSAVPIEIYANSGNEGARGAQGHGETQVVEATIASASVVTGDTEGHHIQTIHSEARVVAVSPPERTPSGRDMGVPGVPSCPPEDDTSEWNGAGDDAFGAIALNFLEDGEGGGQVPSAPPMTASTQPTAASASASAQGAQPEETSLI